MISNSILGVHKRRLLLIAGIACLFTSFYLLVQAAKSSMKKPAKPERQMTLYDWRRFYMGEKDFTNLCLNIPPNIARQFTNKKRRLIESEISLLGEYEYLTKTTFEVRKKIIFIAGVDHSGHNFMQTAWNKICTLSDSFCHLDLTFFNVLGCNETLKDILAPIEMFHLVQAARGYFSEVMVLNTFG